MFTPPSVVVFALLVQLQKDLPSLEERFHILVSRDTLKMLWDRGGYAVKIAKK